MADTLPSFQKFDSVVKLSEIVGERNFVVVKSFGAAFRNGEQQTGTAEFLG